MKKRVWHAPVFLKQWTKNEKRYKVFLAMEQSDNDQKAELKNQLFLTTLPVALMILYKAKDHYYRDNNGLL